MLLRGLLGPLIGCAVGFVLGAGWQGFPDSKDVRGSAVGAAQPSITERNSRPLMLETGLPTLVLEVDGRLTGHFDRVTPQWLTAALEHTGVSFSRTAVAAQATTVAVDESAQDTAPAVRDAALQALRTGSDVERVAALTLLVEHGVEIPAGDLIETFQSSGNDRLALIAFTAYVDSVAEDSGAAREALARGLESINAAVREDAARRMVELERLVQAHASIAAQGLQ